MATSLRFFLAVFAAFATMHFQDSATLDWTSSPPDGATVLACLGKEAILEWNFTLEAGDEIQDMRWYVAGDTSNDIIATFTDGNFLTIPTFTRRLRHLGQAALALDHVTVMDKADYSVDMDMHLASGTYATQKRSVHLEVVAKPASMNGELAVTQGRRAGYNNMNADWHVKLTCGMFLDLGLPQVDVLWKTPSGSSQASSNYSNGYFELLLDNPVEGGNYTCRLNTSSPASVCFHGDDPMMKEVSVEVDEVKARLTLLEARQDTQSANLASIQTQLDEYRVDNANLTHQIESLKGKESQHVAFTASIGALTISAQNNVIILFDQVITNTGNAFDTTTSSFRAPYDGDYMFLVSVDVDPTYRTLNVKKSGHTVLVGHNDRNSGFHITTGGVVSLKTGDVVAVYHGVDVGYVDGGPEAVFAGFRIQ